MTTFNESGVKIDMENGDNVQLYGSYYATSPFELQYEFKSSVGESLLMPFNYSLNNSNIAYFSAVSIYGDQLVTIKVNDCPLSECQLNEYSSLSIVVIINWWIAIALVVT
ncbi:hypothetical protein SteCoe_34817 [Stentor coeruleus]|uniref:Uncharacterized protein n=1 Tax=Stentor coeruleus TaxID=5963 RepID=A0A1R2ATP5_9CILI|nr:hypothetical protein SteCoe_34817 [Stentor coeruleus]